jgi:hypothetical protein
MSRVRVMSGLRRFWHQSRQLVSIWKEASRRMPYVRRAGVSQRHPPSLAGQIGGEGSCVQQRCLWALRSARTETVRFRFRRVVRQVASGLRRFWQRYKTGQHLGANQQAELKRVKGRRSQCQHQARGPIGGEGLQARRLWASGAQNRRRMSKPMRRGASGLRPGFASGLLGNQQQWVSIRNQQAEPKPVKGQSESASQPSPQVDRWWRVPGSSRRVSFISERRTTVRRVSRREQSCASGCAICVGFTPALGQYLKEATGGTPRSRAGSESVSAPSSQVR